MALKIGMPRGLLYYRFQPFWRTFYEELGAEIVVSPNTTKKILDEGVKCCVDEACLPVKIFHGHVCSLKDKADYLLIPRYTSISKNEYVCPKFGGLPDMVKSTVKGSPPVIATEINIRKNPRQVMEAVLDAGRYATGNSRKIKAAFKSAVNEQNKYEAALRSGVIPAETFGKVEKKQGKKLRIAVIGHYYNLFDSYLNMNLLRKLSDLGTDIVTLDMLEPGEIDRKASTLHKRMFWYFGRKAVGGIMCLLEDVSIDGIIYVMSFGCGVDSFICDLSERKARVAGKPFMVLTLDEHSGEAGLATRIEAFTDLLTRKKHLTVSR